MFADDTVVSKGMVKYASQITRESIVDVGGLLSCPEAAVEGCSQSNVSGSALSHRHEMRGLGAVIENGMGLLSRPTPVMKGCCDEGSWFHGMACDSDGKRE